MIVESLLKKIRDGMSGINQGISTGLDKLDSVIDGITKSTYYVIFSNSGAGKTSACLYSFVYRPLTQHLDDGKLRIVYFSLEMNPDMIMAKLLSTYIFEKYGRELSMKRLLSRQKGYTLSEENFKIVQECIPWLEKVEKNMLICSDGLNSSKLSEIILKDLKYYGNFEHENGNLTFKWNKSDVTYLVIIDHIGLVRPQNGNNLKKEIDETSKNLIRLRNVAGITPVVIQQANREQGSAERRKQGMTGFTINDTKDSGGPVTDAEIVLSIYNPNRDRLATYRGYDISKLEDKFRIISVLKSRYGDSDVEIGVNYFGWINYWKELPKPDAILTYDKYENPKYLLATKDDEKDKPAEQQPAAEVKTTFNFKI